MAVNTVNNKGTKIPTGNINNLMGETAPMSDPLEEVAQMQQTRGLARRGLRGTGISGFNRGKEDKLLNEAALMATDLFKEQEINVKVVKVNNHTFAMEYSSLLLLVDGENGSVYYYTILLEGTGRAPQDIHHIVDNMLDKRSNVLKLACDMLNDRAYGIYSNVVEKRYPGKTPVSLNGQVFHEIQNLENDFIDVLLNGADTVISKVAELQNKLLDVDADSILLTEDGTKYNRTEISMSRRGVDILNGEGMPEYSDATIVCSVLEEDVMMRDESDYRQNNNADMIVSAMTEVNINVNLITLGDVRYDGSKTVKSLPQITINGLIGRSPSLGYALFGIAQATLFCSGAELQGLIFEKDIGPMNLVYNFRDLGKNGTGQIVSFSDNSISENDIGEYISTFVENKASLAIRVPISGPGYSFLSIFSDATAVVGDTHIDPATSAILEAASDFTGVECPNIPVLFSETFDIPTGYYTDSKIPGDTPHDLGTINEVFIAKLGDVNLLNQYTIANLPPEDCLQYSHMDNFQLMLNIYSKVAELLGLVIKISGRSAVVSLNPEFVDFLSRELGSVMLENGRTIPRFSPTLVDFTTFEDVNSQMVNIGNNRNFGVVTQGFGVTDRSKRRISRHSYRSQTYR